MAALSAQIKQWKRQLTAAEQEQQKLALELARLYDQAADNEQRITILDGRREALTAMITGAERLEALDRPSSGSDEEQEADDAPRGREAVRRAMHERRDEVWRPADIVAAVIDKGWIDSDARDPGASVRVAARRLYTDGELEKVGNGYRLRRFPGGTLPGLAARTAGELETRGRLVEVK